MRTTRSIAALAALAVLVAACGGSEEGASTTAPPAGASDTSMADDMVMHEMDEFAFGAPMEAADASIVIEITAGDDFAFDPAEITLSVDEVVTLRVTNVGAIPHDFTLGDAALQAEHEAEMAAMTGMTGMADEPNAFVLQPGETKEMTWHFTQPGELIFGCHQVGHYAAGMRGTIIVEG